MALKKTKQPIMGLAAFLIVLFHLFPVSRSNDIFSSVVRYIIMTAYIGVDIFFFMAGYMARFSDTDKYFLYIKRKLLNVYPIFIFSCILFIIIGKLSVKKALFTISGIDLFISGGGSFLWFIPAIMIFYFLVPFYQKLTKKIGSIQAFTAGLVIWTVIMLVLEKFLTNHSINIFLCRIPIILLGFMLAAYEGKWRRSYRLVSGALLLVIGIVLTWNFGYMIKANFPISDIFYVTAIPQTAGIILLADVIFEKVKTYFFEFLGKLSLELYCLQMVFGSLLFGYVIRYVSNGVLAFAAVFMLIVILSRLIHIKKKTG